MSSVVVFIQLDWIACHNGDGDLDAASVRASSPEKAMIGRMHLTRAGLCFIASRLAVGSIGSVGELKQKIEVDQISAIALLR